MTETSFPKLNISSQLIHDEALKRDIKCTRFNDPNTVLMEKAGKMWYIKGSRTSTQSSIGKSLADFKHLTKYILNHFSIPTAPYVVVKNMSEIEKVTELSFPVVGKPTVGNHGDGVIVGIKNLKEAREYAQYQFDNFLNREDEYVIFEELLQGKEYRILCIDYKFVAAAYRKPAFVTGDGVHTITQLIEEKNQHPWRSDGHIAPLTKIIVDELVIKKLTEEGLTTESVPAAGQDVILRKTGNLSTGGEAWNVSNEVHPENKALFEKIARVCDLNTTGIDVMCSDLSKPIVGQEKAGVIEVNVSPGLRMHHYPLQGEPVNAAGLILDMVEKTYGIA
jgi:cyanophycin synthetase